MASEGPNPLLFRAPGAGIAERSGELLVVGTDRAVRKLTGPSAELAREVLSFLSTPRTRAQLNSHLEALSGKPIEHAGVVEDLLKLLLAAGVLRDAPVAAGPEKPRPPAKRGPRVVLGLTGAIGSAHAPAMVAALLDRGCDLEIAATEAALTMVSQMALEALTHRRVYASLRGHEPENPVPHIQLAGWAEVVLVSPATATTLSRIARGDCSDVVSALVIATRAPVLIAPSMNPAMLGAPAVQRNLELLRRDGMWIVDPASAQEVAQAPEDRHLLWGGAPPPSTLLPLLDALLTLQREKPPSG